MDEYPNNSRKQTTEPQTRSKSAKVQQVTTNKVIVKKPGLGKRFAAAFTGDDGKSVAQHVFWDVIVPEIRDMVVAAGEEALNRAVYGESRSRRRTSTSALGSFGSALASQVNYNKMSSVQPQQPASRPSIITRGRVSIEDIILATRVEADEVISQLAALIEAFGEAKVADLYDLVGVTGEYTDEKFGWFSMDGARPRHVSGGYMLDLPRPTQLG